MDWQIDTKLSLAFAETFVCEVIQGAYMISIWSYQIIVQS